MKTKEQFEKTEEGFKEQFDKTKERFDDRFQEIKKWWLASRNNQTAEAMEIKQINKILN